MRPKETQKEIDERKKKVCAHCAFSGLVANYVVCDYIGMTGHRRPCEGRDCVEQGVFVKKRKGVLKPGQLTPAISPRAKEIRKQKEEETKRKFEHHEGMPPASDKKAYQKEWRKRHREKIAQKQKEYYARTREKRLQHAKEIRERDRKKREEAKKDEV